MPPGWTSSLLDTSLIQCQWLTKSHTNLSCWPACLTDQQLLNYSTTTSLSGWPVGQYCQSLTITVLYPLPPGTHVTRLLPFVVCAVCACWTLTSAAALTLHGLEASSGIIYYIIFQYNMYSLKVSQDFIIFVLLIQVIVFSVTEVGHSKACLLMFVF